MATDKPLPDNDDDIIDLTDLVEEGSAAGGAATDADADGVDMSFEQELDDLFGDAEPMPAKAAPAAKATPAAATDADDDTDDLFDLAGFEVADTDTDDADATEAKPVLADADDDIMDLSGLGLESADDTPAGDSLTDLGFNDDQPVSPAKAAAPAGADDTMDISELGFDDLVPDDTPGSQDTADSLDAFDFGDLEEKPAAATDAVADAQTDDALDFETSQPPSPQAAADLAALLTSEDDSPGQDISDADLDTLLVESDEAASDAAMADLLGELPDAPLPELATLPDEAEPAGQPDVAEASGRPDMPDMADTAVLIAPTDEDHPTVPPLAAAAIPLAAMAAVGTAKSDAGPCVGGIDLGALDTLIDSSKAPSAAAETPAAPDNALLARLDALEAAAASLGQRLDALPQAPSEDALAQALADRLEDSLAARFEALLASQPAAPDLDDLKAGLLDELHAALAAHRDALRSELPAPSELVRPDDLTNALEGLRDALARLEAHNQDRQSQFDDFTQSMETAIAELRRELPAPTDFVSPQSLSEALDSLRQTLADDLTSSLEARLDAVAEATRHTADAAIEPLASRLDALEADRVDPEALAQILRQSLADDLAMGLDDRLKVAVDAARTEAANLSEPLASRLDALEANRIDPDALAAKLRETLLSDALDPTALQEAAALAAKADAAAQKALAGLDARLTRADCDTALDTLRAELTASMERTVPQAAATVIREEIAALLKDFSE